MIENHMNRDQRGHSAARALRALLRVFLVLGLAAGVSAQGPELPDRLDDTWTVTVGGQSVQVEPGGGFKLRNIAAPDLFGAGGPGTAPDFRADDFVRVVGTRTIDGVTQYAFSQPFQILQGQTFVIDDIIITDRPPPLTERLSMTIPSEVVIVDQSAQLAVNATLADGTNEDVTLRERFTIYRTSNPAIAAVSGDGLVTGVGVGTAFITAVNEGATAVKRVTVASSTLSTRLEGRVQFEDGTPAVGAQITVLNGAAVSQDPDGTFAVPDLVLPVDIASLSVSASVTVGEETFFASVAGITPVPGGITDAGILVLRPLVAEFEDELGVDLNLSLDDFERVDLGFVFPFYSVDQTDLFVGSHGYITFGNGDTDFTESVTEHLRPEPRISVFFDDINPSAAGAGAFVNHMTNPNRLVVTWNETPEFPSTGRNTLQAILFESGRIQLGYNGMTARDSVVGLSPGGSNPAGVAVDFNSLTTTTNFGPLAIYQQFTFSVPFDLDNAFVIFESDGNGGYDTTYIESPITSMLGSVTGSITDTDGGPCVNAVLEVTSSNDPDYMGVVSTDAVGNYTIDGVPFGAGVTVRVAGRDDLVGGQVVGPTEASVTIDVIPQADIERTAAPDDQ